VLGVIHVLDALSQGTALCVTVSANGISKCRLCKTCNRIRNVIRACHSTGVSMSRVQFNGIRSVSPLLIHNSPLSLILAVKDDDQVQATVLARHPTAPTPPMLFISPF
jgi:hypothetical protein